MAIVYSVPGYLAVVQDTTENGGLYGQGQYALDAYKVAGATGADEIEKLHYYAMKKEFPAIGVEGYLDDYFEVAGKHFDLAYFGIGYKEHGLLDQAFSDTATTLLGEYERVYDITSGSGASTATRRAAIQTKQRATGELNAQYYIDLAATLGYTITITEGEALLFRCGYAIPPATAIPAQVFSPAENWTWHVSVAGASSGADLEAMLDELKPAWTLVEYTYVP